MLSKDNVYCIVSNSDLTRILWIFDDDNEALKQCRFLAKKTGGTYYTIKYVLHHKSRKNFK